MEVHDALPATRQHHRQQQQQQHDTMASSRAAWQQQSMMAAALTTVSPRLLSMGAVSGQQGPASGCRQCHDDQNSRLQQQQAQAQPHDKDDKPREGGNTWQQLARQVAEGKALASRLDKGLLHRLATLENQVSEGAASKQAGITKQASAYSQQSPGHMASSVHH